MILKLEWVEIKREKSWISGEIRIYSLNAHLMEKL